MARDLAPLGYEIVVFDGDSQAGGMIRSQIPRFRLPEKIIDEETGYVLRLGVAFRGATRIDSLRGLLAEDWDAVFVGSGAPRGRDLTTPRPQRGGSEHPHRHRLALVGLVRSRHAHRQAGDRPRRRQHRDGLLPSSRRLGGSDVKVIVRSPFEEMKASPWEKEDAIHEGIPILDCLVPKAFVHEGGKLVGMRFEKVRAVRDTKGRRQLVPTGEPEHVFGCDDVLVAVGQENAFPWIERDAGVDFDEWGMPVLDPTTLQSTLPRVFFGGDAALGPKNIIWAVAQGHAAAISIDKFLNGEDVKQRPPPGLTLISQKMGIHEWSYDNAVTPDLRSKVPWRDINQALGNIKVEVELGFDVATAWKEAERCLNCDVQTVFTTGQCIECDACVDVCPTDCITFTENGDEADLRTRLRAPARHLDQSLYVSGTLKTGRVMVKDEDVCLHCGLCAERCPTGAWDMQKFLINPTQAGRGCRANAGSAGSGVRIQAGRR